MKIKHNIYINIDGFARYYFDEFIKRSKEEPFLKRIIKEGVFFDNLRNALPSITNPCQNMILSGSTSKITNNVYRYYDKENNIVVQQKRENKTKLISQVAVENDLSVLSVAHFLTEKDLTNYDKKRLYVKNPGIEKYNHLERFNQLIKIINKEEVIVDDQSFIIDEFPNLVILYADDLDGLGHNFDSTYGSTVALNEEDRLVNVLTVLKQIDQKIEEVVNALKANNLYETTRIFITTDHGMTPYGSSVEGLEDKYTYSKANELIDKIEEYDTNFKVEFLGPNEVPKEETNVVMVGANLNVQLIFKNKIKDSELNKLKKFLLKEEYIYNIKTREELDKEGFWTYTSDITISPSKRYHFSRNTEKPVFVKGQHDSMQDSANKIVGWIFGGDTLSLGNISDIYYNYDFGVTIANSLGIVLPKFNGQELRVFKGLI